MNPKTHYSALDLARLQLNSLPQSKAGVLLHAKKGNWKSQKRTGRGGGKEYAFDSLPAETQAEIRLKSEAQLIEPLTKKVSHNKETAIAMRDTTRLTKSQRDPADARLALVAYVHQLQRNGMGRKAAVAEVSRQSQQGALPQALQKMAQIAVVKQRKNAGFGQRALHGWVIRCRALQHTNGTICQTCPCKTGLPRIRFTRDYLVT
ncbi:MAG: DNA-binding protein [Ostreibacterium sp.]